MLQSKTQEGIIAGNPAMYEHFFPRGSFLSTHSTDRPRPHFVHQRNFEGLSTSQSRGRGMWGRAITTYYFFSTSTTAFNVYRRQRVDVAASCRVLDASSVPSLSTLRANGNDIPLEDHSLDCVFTFNAIHHFDLIQFVRNAVRLLKTNGNIFMYTRLRVRNAGNIWGQYFPLLPGKRNAIV